MGKDITMMNIEFKISNKDHHVYSRVGIEDDFASEALSNFLDELMPELTDSVAKLIIIGKAADNRKKGDKYDA